MMMTSFGALAIRGLLFANVHDPFVLVAVQVFDGITASVFAVMVPPDRRRRRLRHRPLQSGAGDRRHRDRHRCFAVDGARRLRQRPFGSGICLPGNLATVAWIGFTLIVLLMPETRRLALRA
jgi:hypothetical protein